MATEINNPLTIESGSTNIIVEIKGTMIEDVYNMIRRANLNPGSQININDYVNITGKVVAVPRSISKRFDYKGFSAAELRVGDSLIFSYLVVSDILEKEGGDYVHKNSVVIRGKEYWLCDIRNAFAYIRNGEMTMLNNYVMITQPSPPTRLILPSHDKKVSKFAVQAEVMATNRRSEFYEGDKVLVDYNKLQHYKLNEISFSILDGRYVYGRI